jgi:hypothetical protein
MNQRLAVMGPALMALWEDNYRVYGARKLWKARSGYGAWIGEGCPYTTALTDTTGTSAVEL